MENLPSTEHYKIEICSDPEHSDVLIYGILNKSTGVFEYFDNLLPRAYEALQHTEQKYVEMLAMISSEGETIAPVIQLGEDSGNTSH